MGSDTANPSLAVPEYSCIGFLCRGFLCPACFDPVARVLRHLKIEIECASKVLLAIARGTCRTATMQREGHQGNELLSYSLSMMSERDVTQRGRRNIWVPLWDFQEAVERTNTLGENLYNETARLLLITRGHGQ